MQTVFHSGGNLALKRNRMLKKANRETRMCECFTSLVFSPRCQFSPNHTVSAWSCSLLGHSNTEPWCLTPALSKSIHIAYYFQSRLVTATTFCPDLKPHVELPIQPPSCSRMKPDILPFPNKLFQPDSLANHPQDLDEEWKFALYPNWCQHCFRKVSWITSKNHRSDSGRVLDVFSLLGDKVTAPCMAVRTKGSPELNVAPLFEDYVLAG